MIPTTLCAIVAVLSSLAAVNGAVVQRDGTFTYLTPQPTLQGGGSTSTTSSQSTAASSSQSTTSVSIPTTTTTTQSTTSFTPVSATQSKTSTTPSTTATSATTTPTTTSTVTVIPSTVSVPMQTSTTSASTTPTTTATTTKTIPTITATIPSTVASSPPGTATATATSTSAPGAVNCNGVQNWQSAFAYTAGDRVIFNGQLFTAKQWTFNNAPPTHPDQWAIVGTCAQPINNQANCNGVVAWQSTVAYTAGNRVTFNGRLWSAVQWTESNSPGDASGSWKDLGACA